MEVDGGSLRKRRKGKKSKREKKKEGKVRRE